MTLNFLFDGPERAKQTLLLAHGAGGPMDPPSLSAMSQAIAGKGLRVARFEFDYMLIIGGKSLGGRVASMVADGLYASAKISGLLCLGYPFHPPGKPDELRTRHLVDLKTPTLIVQGTRDPLETETRCRSTDFRRPSRFIGLRMAITI